MLGAAASPARGGGRSLTPGASGRKSSLVGTPSFSGALYGGGGGGGSDDGSIVAASQSTSQQALQHQREAEELATVLAQEVQKLRADAATHATATAALQRNLEKTGAELSAKNRSLASVSDQQTSDAARIADLEREAQELRDELLRERTVIERLRAELVATQARGEQEAAHKRQLAEAEAKVAAAKAEAEAKVASMSEQGDLSQAKREAQAQAQAEAAAVRSEAESALQAERHLWQEERTALRESHQQLSATLQDTQDKLTRRSSRLRRAKTRIESLDAELDAARSALEIARERKFTEDEDSRLAKVASAAAAVALRDSSFAEQTCARVEMLLQRAQQQSLSAEGAAPCGGGGGDGGQLRSELDASSRLPNEANGSSALNHSSATSHNPYGSLNGAYGYGERAWSRLNQVLGD